MRITIKEFRLTNVEVSVLQKSKSLSFLFVIQMMLKVPSDRYPLPILRISFPASVPFLVGSFPKKWNKFFSNDPETM
jgi:hypothetical protein